MNIELQQVKTAKALLAAMTTLPLSLNRVLLPAACGIRHLSALPLAWAFLWQQEPQGATPSLL